MRYVEKKKKKCQCSPRVRGLVVRARCKP